MATALVFDDAMFNIGAGLVDLNSDTFKAVLSNTAPDQAAHDELADITEIANGNGYTTGGVTLSNVTWAETAGGSGIWQWSADDFSWTASGGSIGTFRYVVIYSDTSTGDKLLLYVDYGTTLDITTGNTFLVDVQASGLARFTVS
jgi:hypothetical protein